MRLPRVPVTFHFSSEPGIHVELAGDFPDWKYPVRMTEQQPGSYVCTLHLEPGIYRYKFRRHGPEWVMDPNAPIVDWLEGVPNGLCIVGGTSAPLWFAPDRRHFVQTLDGKLAIHAESREHHAPSHITLFDGEGRAQDVALEQLRHQDGHVFLRATVEREHPAQFLSSEETLVALPEPRPLVGEPPAWLDGAVFYAIFVDRWRRGRNSPVDTALAPRTALSTPETFFGGDLDGVTESLDEIAALGVTAVVLTPIHPSPSPHRYDGTNLLAVDEKLGGDAALARLLSRAHALDLKVILDAAITHVHENHPAFQDVLEKQDRSEFAQWFRVRRFPVVRRDASTFAHYYGNPQLPWLDLAPGPAREHVITAMERLVKLGADGLRLDAMNDAPDDFWRELRARVRAINAQALLMGEIVSDNAARLAEERGVDTATDFGHKDACVAFFARPSSRAEDFRELLRRLEHRMGPFDPCFRLLFLDNHDTPRFMTLAANYDRVRVALAWLLLRPEPVWLTYGTELGMFGGRLVGDLDDAWPERLPMPAESRPTATSDMIRALIALRRHEPALKSPVLRWVHAEGRLLVVDRGEREVLRIMINAGESPIDVARFVVPGSSTLAHVHGDAAQGNAPAWSVTVLRMPS